MYIFKERHNLSNLNIFDKTATCSVCGVAPIKTSKTANPRCRYAFRETKRNSYHAPASRIPDAYKPAILREAVYRSRAKKRGQLPLGVDINLMKNIYIFCPTGYEVDHIKAIANGGLHEPANLQYLPIGENRRKYSGNSYDRTLSIDWRSIVK